MVDLDELERWSKPPAEPWKVKNVFCGGVSVIVTQEFRLSFTPNPAGCTEPIRLELEAHLDTIAATRNAMPAIIAELRAARRKLEAVKAATELVRQCNCECWNNGHECLEDAIEALETATKGDG